ncbi:MAG TPA: hypothetical protein VD884_11430 [Ohtaekwangia sp.]|nr:hypothetical protein [Ohtaekwangia sp.]
MITKKWFTFDYDAFMSANQANVTRVNENTRYEKIPAAARVDLSTGELLFFKHGTLKMIYISEEALTKKLWDEFRNSFATNTPEKTVRSPGRQNLQPTHLPKPGYYSFCQKRQRGFYGDLSGVFSTRLFK